MRHISVLAGVLALWAQPASGAPATLGEVLANGDMQAMTDFVVARFRDGGVSVNEGLEWQIQDFDEVLNWYNDFTDAILIARMPEAGQEAAYWTGWSDLLTGGTWDWRAFFEDGAEALRLARFNQFYLAAHEYGHALTYRYDPEHEKRWDRSINCREYFADRLAAAMLDELATEDEETAALRARYRLLIGQINDHIAAADRHAVPDFAALEVDCRITSVAQPKPDTMTPYASAFFARQSALLAEDLPPLADLYARHLFPWWEARRPADSGLAGPVSTLGPLEGLAPHDPAGPVRRLAFAPDGRLFEVEDGTRFEEGLLTVRLAYGAAGTALEPIGLIEQVEEGAGLDNPRVFAALGPDRFLLLNTGYGDADEGSFLLDVSRDGDGWNLRLRRMEVERLTDARVVAGMDGAIHVFLRDRLLSPEDWPRWRRLRLDARTLDVLDQTRLSPALSGAPVAVDRDGNVIFDEGAYLTVAAPGGEPKGLAGGLRGFKDDEDPMRAEFAVPDFVVSARQDGSLLVLDVDPRSGGAVLRRIAPRP